jgi:hypothetical protein
MSIENQLDQFILKCVAISSSIKAQEYNNNENDKRNRRIKNQINK